MKTTSFRLGKKELDRLEKLASEEDKGKSEVARELLNYGWEHVMVRRYKEGKISLGVLSRNLGISISETIDFLAELGIRAPISREDVFEGYETLRKEY